MNNETASAQATCPPHVVTVAPVPVSSEALAALDATGLVCVFKPAPQTEHPGEDENVAASIYDAADRYGPHRLISVGVNRTTVRLGVHGDNEEFLLPPHGAEVKPLYLLICHLPADEIRRRDRMGALSTADFTCLSLYPAPRGAEMFTMPAGVVHCEVTTRDAKPIGCFFVTESRDLNVDWVDLSETELRVAVNSDN